MQGWIASVTLAALGALAPLAACSAGDDTVDGSRANCELGGTLTDCPDAARTTEAACWRLVDCGAIAVDAAEEFVFDWGRCVDALERSFAENRRLVVACIAASTCDELRVPGSPDAPDTDRMSCLQLGGQ